MDADVIVVGGGLAGLACAIGLAGSDLDVMVLEQADRLGGRAASTVDETTGDVVDTGPHIIHSRYDNLLALAKWIGTDAQIVWQDDKLLTVADDGNALDVRSAPLAPPLHLAPSMLGVPSLSLADKLSGLPASLRALTLDERDVADLDTVTAAEFLRACGTSPRLMQWFWGTASMTIAALPLEQCSAAALLRFHQQLLAHADVRIGLPGVGLGDLLADPARRLIEHNGGRVCTGARVTAVHLHGKAGAEVQLADGVRLFAHQVVLAVPPQAVRSLEPLDEGGPIAEGLECFVPSPCVCCYLWFDRKVTPHRYWTRTALSRPLNFDWYDLSNIRPGADERSLIASNIVYSPRIGGLSDAAIVEATRRELALFAPAAAEAGLRHARVHRIPMSIPCARPGIERLRPTNRTRVRNLHLAGDWTATGLPFSMESAVRSGLLAAEAVRYAAGCPHCLAHPVPELRGLPRVLRSAPRAFATLLPS